MAGFAKRFGWGFEFAARALLTIAPLSLAACAAVSDEGPASEMERFGKEGAAVVDGIYTVDGWMSLEDDYLPRVCTQENGAADYEALKAQAVAARTYLLRAMRDDAKLGTQDKPIINGQSFQAYADVASDACIKATNETRGVVGRYMGELIIANYVAGALVNDDGSLGADATHTEKWITYNEGKTGADVQPTALSYIPRSDNRGCMGQNRSDWLAEQGYDYASILRYFYGADLELNDPSLPQDSPPQGGGSQGGCGDLTFQGTCDGNTVVWCENGAVNSFNCNDNGKVCGYQDDSIGYNCLEPQAPPPQQSGCGDLTYHGKCEGTVLVWCENDQVQSFECTNSGLVCAYQDDNIGYNCL